MASPGADIQVAYATPDSTWDDWAEMRVLTGRDFDLEVLMRLLVRFSFVRLLQGMAVKNSTYAVMGEELMPALFAINPSTGEVLSGFVRTPDIDKNGNFNGQFLSSTGDKVHCTIAALEANECMSVDGSVVEASDFVRHGSSGGYEGLVMMADGSVTAFIENNGGGSQLAERGEPGQRVFKVNPDPLQFEDFLGFYKLELGATAIADASAIPGAPTKIAVAERSGFPQGSLLPGQRAPNNRVCMIDLTVLDENRVFVKQCVLNYQRVQDPFDADGDALTTAAFSQITTEQLIFIDDWCAIVGTDTNFPSTNQFGVSPADAPYIQEVTDTRWMIVCFNEAVTAYPTSE